MPNALVNIFETMAVEESDAFKERVRVFSHYLFARTNFG